MRPRPTVCVLLLSMILGGAAAADDVILLKNLKPGTHVLIVTVDASGGVVVTRPTSVTSYDGTTTSGPTPTPPAPTSELAKFTRAELVKVPDHKNREIATTALATIFRSIGDQYKAGKVPEAKLTETLDRAIATTLKALGAETHWSGFLQAIRAEVTRRQLRDKDQVAEAFGQIANGLSTDNEAISDVLPQVVALIAAVVSGDEAAIVRAVLDLVTALIGG